MPRSTGVFLDDDELEQVKTLTQRAAKTPVISFDGKTDLASLAWDSAKRTAHRFALAHDLPEIQGYYGVNLETGEILA